VHCKECWCNKRSSPSHRPDLPEQLSQYDFYIPNNFLVVVAYEENQTHFREIMGPRSPCGRLTVNSLGGDRVFLFRSPKKHKPFVLYEKVSYLLHPPFTTNWGHDHLGSRPSAFKFTTNCGFCQQWLRGPPAVHAFRVDMRCPAAKTPRSTVRAMNGLKARV